MLADGNLTKDGVPAMSITETYASTFFETYRRSARIMARYSRIEPGLSILDWGAGEGFLARELLLNGARNISLLDIDSPNLSLMPELSPLPFVKIEQPFQLPYKDESFDIVVSQGVLEHVPLIDRSLDEVYRVLKPGGYFFVFAFPQRTSYIGFITGFWNRDPHPRKYSMKELVTRLQDHGFIVKSNWRYHMLPKKLSLLPGFLKGLYGALSSIIFRVDEILSSIPLLNRISTSIECYAMKVPYMDNIYKFDDYLAHREPK